MKRGKDEEKLSGAMFPRLHVNDADKGGPRAPPRNKMALYEQLSIPSKRFNPGVVPLSQSSPSNLAPPSSSCQGSSLERNLFFTDRVSPSTLDHGAIKFPSSHFDRGNISTSLAQLEKKRKLRDDDDDFTVPVFVHSGVGQNHNKAANGIDWEKSTPIYPGRAMETQNLADGDPKLIRSSTLSTSQNAREQSEQNTEARASTRDPSVSSSTNSLCQKVIAGPEGEVNGTENHHLRDHCVGNSTRSHTTHVPLQQKPVSGPFLSDIEHKDSALNLIRDSDKGKTNHPTNNSTTVEVHSRLNKQGNESQCRMDDTGTTLQLVNSDQGLDMSMVDSISVLEISPDDVVKIIGQKQFWKARRVIANQQRVFAVQVFELHRLIKVQQLIAASPDLLLEDSIVKPSMKSSPVKNFSSSHVITPVLNVAKCNNNFQNLNQKIESSAENAVVKTSSVKKVSQAASPHLENSTPVSLPIDSQFHPWPFPHPLGHQWLVPVMSPSEGLVYKPYATTGLMGSVYGGCGNVGATPLTGHAMNPPYGFPASHHHHHPGVRALPGTPHTYFPPYGMLAMNPVISGSVVDQMNHFTEHASNGQTTQLSVDETNFCMQPQKSSNVPIQKSPGIPQVTKLQASKDADQLGSTASSPSQRGKETCTVVAAEGRDKHHLSPVASDPLQGGALPQETEQLAKVIKVVPHNGRSATESAARIFQSIQEERKQYESM